MSVKNQIIGAIAKAAGVEPSDIRLDHPEIAEHGDYSTNIALGLKGKENPREKAQELILKLKADPDLGTIVEKIEVAGPGFINLFVSQKALTDNLQDILEKKEGYGKQKTIKGKTVIVDYSAPNIAKSFGIGHLRSTIIGQALYNLYQAEGYETIGDNHLGDWGTQFGTLLYQVTSKNLDVKTLSVADLEKLYVEFHKQAEENPELWEKAREWFKKLEVGNEKAREIWQIMVTTSMAEFNRIYKILNVKIDSAYGESFYETMLPEVIEDAKLKGLAKESRGALVVEVPGSEVPLMLIKSDGATTYATRDLATLKYRESKWHPKIVIYEVGVEQALHFQQVFAVARMLGYVKENTTLIHTKHGWYLGEDGKKFSTRKGKTVKLTEVLDEAIERAGKIIEKSETGRGLNEKEKEEVARKVGVGAVKYFDLSHNPETDIVFSWEKMFLMEGNSGPYLQYTYARILSVLAKNPAFKGLTPHAEYNFRVKNDLSLNKEEEGILRTLVRFSDVITDAAESYSPNLITNYLYQTAKLYNNFYNLHRIIGSDNEQFRSILSSAVARVIKNGLDILGIETPERM